MAALIVTTPSYQCSSRMAVAAVQSGATGVFDPGQFPLTPIARKEILNLAAVCQTTTSQKNRSQKNRSQDTAAPGNISETEATAHTPSSLRNASWGLLWRPGYGDTKELVAAVDEFGPHLIYLSEVSTAEIRELVTLFNQRFGGCGTERGIRKNKRRPLVLAECTTCQDAIDLESSVDGLVLTGNESGGPVGTDSSFILAQKVFAREPQTPCYVRGGMGPDTAAAVVFRGAAGIVISETIWGCRDADDDVARRVFWSGLDGTETQIVESKRGPNRVALNLSSDALRRRETIPVANPSDPIDGPDSNDRSENGEYVPLGQEIGFSGLLASNNESIREVLNTYRERIRNSIDSVQGSSPFSPGSPSNRFAAIHGLRIPVLQGPMTRVSDSPQFARAIQQDGALPFIALSLATESQADELLETSARELSGKSWGVGILGFVPADLREKQLAAIRRHQPTHVIIAGGRPQQALELESAGIATFVHVPSPGLLKSFLDAGCRRFIFEGRECGGHVGPRSSFVLWQQAIEILRRQPESRLREIQVVFAGGIHDKHSLPWSRQCACRCCGWVSRWGCLWERLTF